MSRRVLIAVSIVMGVASPALCYEIKPKTPETAFSSNPRPDIVGLSTADDAGKAGPIFENYLKDLPSTKPQAIQQKFADTDVTYATSMRFDAAETDGHGAESMVSLFSSPASGNLIYYISRDLGFAQNAQPTTSEMIQRVVTKYGDPTVIGDGQIFYVFKSGKVVSVKQKYTPATATDAINAPLNPKAALALTDTNGRGSCIAVLKHVQAAPDKSLDKLLDDAKAATCDGVLNVAFTPGASPDRVGKATFTLVDLKRIVSAAKIDADAIAAAKADSQKSSPASAPKL